MVVGAATTFLGAAGQLLTPNTPGRAYDQLREIRGDTTEEMMQKLRKAEELLEKSAQREKAGRSWKIHAITGAVNVTSGLITWLGFNRNVWSGIQNFAINTVITEAQIWTQPIRAVKDYENYCRNYKTGKVQVALRPDMTWFVSASPGGIKIKIVF